MDMPLDPFPTPHPLDTDAPRIKAESDALIWADGLAAIVTAPMLDGLVESHRRFVAELNQTGRAA